MATHKIPHTGQEINNAIDNALKVIKKNVTISTSGWSVDSSVGCYKKAISDSQITQDMSVDLIFNIASLAVASDCGVKPITDSYNGGFYIFADSVPVSTMSGVIITR